MMANVEEAVSMIRAAQHEDGYINSYYTVRGINRRWENLRDRHELYCLGHLVEACVAYEMLTRSGRLLEPVMKAIRHVDSLFGDAPGKLRGYPGHQEIEIGLLRLHELTRDPLPLKLATYFLLERGRHDEKGLIYFDHEAMAREGDPYDDLGPDMKSWYQHARDYQYHQADCVISQATEVKGHAVRAMYYYTAATDLVRLTGDEDIWIALCRLWRDLVDTKLLITGGIGTIRQWEGFGPQYFLGDTEEDGTCYAETCASFALINWCQRMLRLSLIGEYGDVMEVSLYNAFLGAVGLDGVSFYYQNPLKTMTGCFKERSRWFEVACCPPNVAKLLGQMGSMIYSFHEGLIVVHLFIASTFTVPNTNVVISQTTSMPWSGEVNIQVQGTTRVALRIPDWAGGFTCSIEGRQKNNYLYIPAAKDHHIKLTLPISPRKVYANPKTNKDEVCIMRGPLVYCLEDVDNTLNVDHLALTDAPLTEGEPISISSVECVVPVIARARELANSNWSSLYGQQPWRYKEEEVELQFIPYCFRANRGGNGGMRTWMRRFQVGA